MFEILLFCSNSLSFSFTMTLSLRLSKTLCVTIFALISFVYSIFNVTGFMKIIMSHSITPLVKRNYSTVKLLFFLFIYFSFFNESLYSPYSGLVIPISLFLYFLKFENI